MRVKLKSLPASTHTPEPRVGQRAHKGRCLALPMFLADRSTRRVAQHSAYAGWRTGGAGGAPLWHTLGWRRRSLARQPQRPRRARGVFSLGTARAGVPFDGGIGGEMTRSNAAADPRRWPIHFCTHKQVVRVVAWTIPACIKPVWGARNAIEAARASRLLQDAAGQHAEIALEAGAL